ncbi:uncharacterized protein cracdlb isoform X2 [Misgurnus anguillicaudatus]
MLIPGRRTEDSGATSEDDGLPCSPPEMSFHEQVMQDAVYKHPEYQNHLSSLSLAGTGSEEEEQGDTFQPSSRPMSPVSKPIICPTPATPPAGVDFNSPVSCAPVLDNSAARHRMSVKPRNQRVSTRANRGPTVSISPRHRSESVNDLDNILSEEDDDDDDETMTSTETMHQRLYSSPTLKLREKPTSPEPKATTPLLSVQNEDDKPTEINFLSTLKSDVLIESQVKVTNNPLYLQPMLSGLSSGRASPVGFLESTQISKETEPLRAYSPIQNHDTNKIQISDRFWKSSENLVCSTDNMNKDGNQPETSFRLHPVTHIKNPKLEIRSPSSPKGTIDASTKPWEVGLEPSTPELSPKGASGSPSGKDTQTLNSASFQFSIASAKYRSKTTHNEVNLKGASGIKIQSGKPNPEPQKDEGREMKPTELQNYHQYQTQETKSSSHREVISPTMSKPTPGNHLKKNETSTEHVEAEKTEEPEDRKNAFGVQLRTTSLSLKYRSDFNKLKDETKRYSYESNQMLSVSQEHAWKAEMQNNTSDGNSRSKPSVPRKQDSQNLESQFTATDNVRPSTQDTIGSSKDAESKPGWMSLAREKTKVYHPLLSKSPQIHSPTVPSLQKPTFPPKTQPLTHFPMKTQHTLNTTNQMSTQQSSQLTQKPLSKLAPNGNKEKPISPGRRIENPFSQTAGGGRLADNKDKGTPAVRNTTPEADAQKKATVFNKMDVTTRQEPITPVNTEAPAVTSEPSPASSSSEVSHHLQPRSDGAEPSWMELAKRKSLAWSDKTLE